MDLWIVITNAALVVVTMVSIVVVVKTSDKTIIDITALLSRRNRKKVSQHAATIHNEFHGKHEA